MAERCAGGRRQGFRRPAGIAHAAGRSARLGDRRDRRQSRAQADPHAVPGDRAGRSRRHPQSGGFRRMAAGTVRLLVRTVENRWLRAGPRGVAEARSRAGAADRRAVAGGRAARPVRGAGRQRRASAGIARRPSPGDHRRRRLPRGLRGEAMLLAINANNTNVKFGVIDGDRIVGEWRQHTSAMRTADEHAVWLLQLMEIAGIDPKVIDSAIIASVVPQATFNLRRLCTRTFSTAPLVLGARNVTYGVQIRGAGAGADRICNTVGASILFPETPLIVLDFGTATTFDVVDEEGSYCGGVIAPGI